MKVVLRKRVPKLGEAGEVLTVKPGFARNYLVPQGLASVASPANIRAIEEERRRSAEEARKNYLEAKRRAARLEGLVVTISAKAGEAGRLFGSVGAKDILDAVHDSGIDFRLDSRTLQLAEPIKTVGERRASLRLHAEVTAEIGVVVEAEAD